MNFNYLKDNWSFFAALICLVIALLVVFIGMCAEVWQESLAVSHGLAKFDNWQNDQIYNVKLREKLASLSGPMQALDDLVLKKEQALDFIMAMENLAKTVHTELELKEIAPISSVEAKAENNYLYFQLTTLGEFTDLVDFVYRLNNYQSLVFIDSLNISKYDKYDSKTQAGKDLSSIEHGVMAVINIKLILEND